MELKSCSPYTFDKINSVEDLRESTHDWLKRYFFQVSLYMVLEGVEEYWLALEKQEHGAIKNHRVSLGRCRTRSRRKR